MGNCNGGFLNRGRLPKMQRSTSNTGYGGLGGADLLRIFEHLSPEDLARCCTVNQWWNKIGGTHRLWKEHCMEACLFEEEDVTCHCELDGTELQCALQSHYSRYMTYKSNFHEGHFSIHAFPWYPYQAAPMTADSSMQLVPEQSVPSCMDERKLVVVCGFLKIWDITVSPTQIFEHELFWEVTAVKIKKSILALLIKTEADSSNSPSEKILVYNCIEYDPQSEVEDFPLYMLPKVKTPKSIALLYCHSIEVCLMYRQWHLSQDWLAISCLNNKHIKFFEAASGIEKFSVEVPKGRRIINGRIVDNMYYYLLFPDDFQISQAVLVALNMVEQSIEWYTKLMNTPRSNFTDAVINLWCRKEILVHCPYSTHMIDRGSGEIISIDDQVMGDQRKLSESSQRFHRALETYRDQVRSKMYYTHQDYGISPFGGILFKFDDEFTFMCGKDKCSGKFTKFEHDKYDIRELVSRRDTRVGLSRKQMTLLCPKYNMIFILNFTNDS